MYIEYLNSTLGNIRTPQRTETKLSDGTSMGRPAGGWQDRQLETLGLYPVAQVEKPADTSTNTHDVTVELATPGDPTTATQVWTSRLFTVQETDAQAAAAAVTAAAAEEQARIDGAAQISAATVTRFRGYGLNEPTTDLQVGDVFFQGGTPPLTYEEEILVDTPLGLWMLDETSGTVAVDQGSVGQNGNYAYTDFQAVMGTRTIFGLTAPDFQGSDVIQIPANAAFNADHVGVTGTATAEFLVRFDSDATPTDTLLYWQYGFPFRISKDSSGLWEAMALWGDFPTMGVNGGTPASDTDYHVVMTYDYAAPRLELWVNGVSILVETTADWDTSTQNRMIFIGASDGVGTSGLNGAICGVAWYSQALSDQRIADHYAALTA